MPTMPFAEFRLSGFASASKSAPEIELNRIDSGVGDDTSTGSSRNELFFCYDHLAAYSTPLETWLYRD
jgi:hypothetical protein